MKKLLRISAAVLSLAGLACIGLFFFKGAGAGKLSWDDPIVRKSIMSFAYKIYGDPAVENGRFFLSKIVFHNAGIGPVHDLSVSYHIPGYVDWTTPQTQSELPPGQTWVALYYPQLPKTVTDLSDDTNANLETRIRWADKTGETKEEILRNNIILRGVNKIEYCDLPQNEVAGFYDWFSTAEFAIAMVTPNDPVVKEFVAEITKRTGGSMAGVKKDHETINSFMQSVYDYMCETGMRYTGDEGVPTTLGDITTTVQTVRMPRDVIIQNQGLCVELAILWASVMEHVGCDASLIFKTNHAFTVVRTEQGDIPIECTAITPKAILGWLQRLGYPDPQKNPPPAVVPFDKAVLLAKMELGDLIQNNKPFTVYDVERYKQQGMRPPELPLIDVDKIKNILSERTKHTAAAYAQNAGQRAQPPATASGQQRPGYYHWVGANKMASIDVPESWTRMQESRVPGLVFIAHDKQTTMDVDVFHFPNLSTAVAAMEAVKRGIAQYAGGTVKISGQQQNDNLTVYTGTTLNQKAPTYQWVGFFGPTQDGVVGFLVGAAQGYFETNQPIIQDIVSSARIGGAQGSENEPR